ncbi:MAG: SMC-Scp complex subunit ScpB [Nitrosopumilus sp.]|nr:SMC-Scp complex subunit ScpB [Nitrosopumilus sp.]
MTKLPADEIIARIEAALYSAGRPLTIDEIVKASGIDSRERIKRLLSDLINKTKIAFKALEIAKLEDGTYVFQLKPSYAPIIKKFSNKPQISNSVMKTLSYVAYEQPVTSKRLAEIRGSKVYMHLKELQDLEFVSHKSSGRVKVYNTTPKFKNYFGISDIATLKKSLLLNPREFVKKNT